MLPIDPEDLVEDSMGKAQSTFKDDGSTMAKDVLIVGEKVGVGNDRKKSSCPKSGVRWSGYGELEFKDGVIL